MHQLTAIWNFFFLPSLENRFPLPLVWPGSELSSSSLSRLPPRHTAAAAIGVLYPLRRRADVDGLCSTTQRRSTLCCSSSRSSSYVVIWAWRRGRTVVNGTEKTDVNFYEHTIEWVDCLGLSTAAQKCKAICLASEAATFNWCLLVRLAGGSSSSLVVRATVRYLPTTGRYLYPKRDCCSCCSARELCSALSKKKKVQSLHTISQHNTQKHKLLSSCQFDATASAQNTVAQQAAVSETNFTAHYRRSLLSLSY